MAEAALCPRARLLATLALAFGIAALQGLASLPVAVGLAAAVVLASGQARAVLHRLRGAALLALAIMVLLAMMAGDTVLAQLGPLRIRLEGLEAGALIALRLLSIVAVTLALLAPLSPFQLVAGLRGLGVPALMADLALLTLRYLDELGAELRRARLARRLRGGRSGWRALPDHALLLATGLIRAQARADRLWSAMRLRGYGTGLAADLAPLRAGDWGAVTAAIIAALALVILDRVL